MKQELCLLCLNNYFKYSKGDVGMANKVKMAYYSLARKLQATGLQIQRRETIGSPVANQKVETLYSKYEK